MNPVRPTKTAFATYVRKYTLLVALVPLTLAIVFDAYNYYSRLRSEAEQTHAHATDLEGARAKTLLVALQLRSMQLVDDASVKRVVQTVEGYSRAATQLAQFVAREELVAGAFIDDGSGYVVEAAPEKYISSDLSVVRGITVASKSLPVDGALPTLYLLPHLLSQAPGGSAAVDSEALVFAVPIAVDSNLPLAVKHHTAVLYVVLDLQRLTALVTPSGSTGVEWLVDHQQVGATASTPETTATHFISSAHMDVMHEGKLVPLALRSIYTTQIGPLVFIRHYWPQGCLFLLVLVVTLLFAHRAIRAISEPINQLTEQSQKVAQGAFDEVSLNTNFAELDQLGASMNHMVAVIAERTAKLRASEASYRNQFLQNVTPMLLVTSESGAILEANEAAAQFYGYSRSQLQTMRLAQLNAPGAPVGQILHVLQQTSEAGGARHECQQQAAQNRVRDVELSISTTQFQDRAIRHLIIHDVTDRNEATAAANRHAAEAQKANEAKSEFLANMSHEIRTPLNGVLGMLDLLLDCPLGATERRYAEIAQRSGSTLLDLINDILDFSKVEANKLSLETVPFNLLELADQVGGILGTRALGKEIEVICAVQPGTPCLLHGDPTRLRQVLLNLGGNAVKFTSRGEVAIRVAMLAQRGSKVSLRFSIHDTGPGIPADKHHLLFQKFSQVDSSTTRKHGGTGLGLAISRQLVELMGGQIGMQSHPGAGSEFWFTVTLERQKQEHVWPGMASLAGSRVLVVDDNATNRDFLVAWLKYWQLRATSCSTGAGALTVIDEARAENDPIRIALLDMNLPGMDGVQLAENIWANSVNAGLKLILISSLEKLQDPAQLARAGFISGLSKPVSPAELRRALLQNPLAAVTPKAVFANAEPKWRVLLVEDGQVNQMVAQGILESLGCATELAQNGSEALQILAERDFDLVLMDVQMPVMDGHEATRRIRRQGSGVRNPAVPVIAMTAYATTEERDLCLQAGMNDHLAKPFTRETLSALLQRYAPRKS